MKIFIGLLFILILSVTDIFLFRTGLLPLEPSLVILPVLFLFVFLNKNYLRNYRYLNGYSFSFFILITTCSILFSVFSSYNEILYVLGLNFLSLILYISSILFFLSIKLRQIKIIFLLSFLVLGLSVLFDLFFSNNIVTRGAGFSENPNSSALRFLFLLIILMFLYKEKKYKILFLIIAIIFIFSTLSRSGMLMLFIVFFLFQMSDYSNYFDVEKLKTSFFRSLFLFSMLIVVFYNSIDFIVAQVPAFQYRATLSRIAQIKGEAELVSDLDQSEEGRVTIAKDYFSKFIKQPMGYGTGMSFNRNFYIHSTHNMYLRLIIDFGLIGIFLFLLFLSKHFIKAFKLKNINYLAFTIIIILSSFFTNSLLENRTFIVSLAVLDVLIKRTTTKQGLNYEKNIF